MPRSATTYNYYPVSRQQLLLIVNHSTQCHIGSLNINTASHAICQTFRLFKYLFQHEMRESAFLYLPQVQVHSLYFREKFTVQYIDNFQVFSLSHYCYGTVLKIYNPVSIFNYRTGVRGQEKLMLAHAYHQRTLTASRYYLIRLTLIKQGHSIRANHLMQRQLHRRKQIKLFSCLHIFYKLHQHLRIGIRTEREPFRLQLFLQVRIIFNYAIVDYRKVL